MRLRRPNVAQTSQNRRCQQDPHPPYEGPPEVYREGHPSDRRTWRHPCWHGFSLKKSTAWNHCFLAILSSDDSFQKRSVAVDLHPPISSLLVQNPMSSPHGIRLEGCQRSFRGEVLQLLHVLNSAVDSFQGKNKQIGCTKQPTLAQATNLSSASREKSKICAFSSILPEVWSWVFGYFLFVYNSQRLPQSPNSNLLDRFSLLGMCWKPFCTHLTSGHFWQQGSVCLFCLGFPTPEQRKSPKLKISFASNGASNHVRMFSKTSPYGVCNKYPLLLSKLPGSFYWFRHMDLRLPPSSQDLRWTAAVLGSQSRHHLEAMKLKDANQELPSLKTSSESTWKWMVAILVSFLFWDGLFSGANCRTVSFRGCIASRTYLTLEGGRFSEVAQGTIGLEIKRCFWINQKDMLPELTADIMW